MNTVILNPAAKTQHETPTTDIKIDNFLGAVRGIVSETEPNTLYVLAAPKSFAWCSLVVQALGGSAELFLTLSSSEAISAGTAVWVPWTSDLTVDNVIASGTARLFTWEWPLVAIGIKSATPFRYEHAHKII